MAARKWSIGSLYRRIKTFLFPYKRLADESFFQALYIANPGMVEPGNLYCFDYAIRNLPTNDPILEIGAFCGLSTNLITFLKHRHHKKNILFSCDKWEFEDSYRDITSLDTVDYDAYQAFVRESFLRNIKFFSQHDLPHAMEMFSDDFFAHWQRGDVQHDMLGRAVTLGGPLSFCFIDGNHTYEYAKRDFENTDQCLVKGGFILFDDSADYETFGSAELMKELKRRSDYEVVLKNPNYLFRKT
jgi:hypothetical protein